MKKRPSRQLECTIPILPVSNLARSIRFYTRKLGFDLDWRGGALGSVSRDGSSIMLRQKPRRDKSVAGWVWIGLASDDLFQTFRARGVRVLQEPRNCSWAYEMLFADPDGNVLWLGTEPKRGLPLADEEKG
jgi:catechol 2,3-dioxygenase-like lactoylglutathione lyase family enzyme